MKLQLIETPDYILAVSDKIEDGINPKVLHFDDKVDKNNIYKSSEMFTGNPMYLHISGIDNDFRTVRKIIAYQLKGNVKELTLPLLPEIVVKDDVEKLALNWFVKANKRDIIFDLGWIQIFEAGYKSATKVYSEEDLRKAIKIAKDSIGVDNDGETCYSHLSTEQIIQSLKQSKTPKWFVAETKSIYNKEAHEIEEGKMELKTTTINGKTYLVGTYE